MSVLRLGFTDTLPSIANYFIDTLRQRYEVIIDNENPDYLIFGDRNFGNNNVNYDPNKIIKIFFTGENERPWNYNCHYAISFEHIDDERFYRLPIYVIYNYDHKLIENRVRTPEDLTDYNKGFASFLVNNPGCEKRNEFFKTCLAYKSCGSAGKFMNNIGGILGGTPVDKVKFMNNYKFNVTFENSSYPGYATEKLMEALCAKTIPLYWGSSTVPMEFNPKAFLNWHDFQDDKAFWNAVYELDTNPKLYEEMYMQPMFVDNQKNKFFDQQRFLNWFDRNVYKGVLSNG
jgi:alpha(1,3/1,4) fucosyltransferase